MEKSFLLGVILALSSSSAAGLALGGTKCTWGPSYWCANIPQAAQCSAVKHCVSAVWEKEKVPEDDDEVCTICKDMVGQARDTLMSNETQEELKEVLEGSCDLIPIGIIAKECKTLSDEFIPELVETLASEMNPDTVCTVAGLCNSERIDEMLAKAEEQKTSQYGGDCNICREGAKKTKEQMKLMTQGQVEDKMLELCGYAGSFSNACMETVLEESDDIYKMLTEQFNEEICDLSGLCSQSFEKVPATQLKEGEDIQCEFCEKVIKHWIDVYASNSSLAEFKQLMDGICEKLDKKNVDHCKHIVDDYYIPAFEFLRNELDPHMLCSVVGLCGESGFLKAPSTSKAPAISMVKLLPANKLSKNALTKSPAALNGPLYVPNAVIESNSPTCVLCEYVLHELQQYIQDGQTEEQIKEKVEAICDHMPGVIKKECKSFIDTYEPAIVAFLVNEIEPTEVCPMLHLCDKQDETLNLQSSGLLSLRSSSNCEMCEFAINEVFSILKDKDDQDMVKNVLESICYRLPNSIERNCENFVETYTSTIINLIINGLTPDEICSALDLCASTTDIQTVPTEVEVKVEVEDSTCVLCEYVITTIDSMLEDKANEAQIKAALESVCSILPKSIEAQCDNFVETYTDIIIDMLTKDVTPEMVCSNLGLCKPKGNIVVHHVDLEAPKDPYCTLCELVIRDLDAMLEDKQNKEEIERALDVLCYQLSDPVHKQCEKMVAKYTEEIIDMFVKEYTPKMMCSELGLCVDNEINTNDIFALEFEEPVVAKANVGCEMCEFAMSIVDEHLKDPNSVDEIERMIQFVCSYLPGTIADKCEEFVDEYGQKVIDALVDDELKPKEVCGQIIPECATSSVRPTCPWGPKYWCATPFHAKACGVTAQCQKTVWKGLGITGIN